ncbi:hypothetical protein ACWN8V_09390 [Vagococcus elongatus]|nr:hypothetical protein [Vagococcus elongatus]
MSSYPKIAKYLIIGTLAKCGSLAVPYLSASFFDGTRVLIG